MVNSEFCESFGISEPVYVMIPRNSCSSVMLSVGLDYFNLLRVRVNCLLVIDCAEETDLQCFIMHCLPCSGDTHVKI